MRVCPINQVIISDDITSRLHDKQNENQNM